MSAIPVYTHAHVEEEVLPHVLEPSASASHLPVPRNRPSMAVLAFMMSTIGAVVAAFLVSVALLHMVRTSVTWGALMLCTVLFAWGSVVVVSALLADSRGEWG